MFRRPNAAVASLLLLGGFACDVRVHHKRRLCEERLELLEMMYERDRRKDGAYPFKPWLTWEEREYLYDARRRHIVYLKQSWLHQLSEQDPELDYEKLRRDNYYYHWLDDKSMKADFIH